MAKKSRNSVRIYIKDEPVDILLDEVLRTMTPGHPSGRSGAARDLLTLGWLASCGYDVRIIVDRLRIPTGQSARAFQFLLDSPLAAAMSNGRKLASLPDAEKSLAFVAPIDHSKPLYQPALEQVRGPQSEVNSQSMDLRQLLQVGVERRATRADLEK